jgi:photosystem P840 reaction center iron-sulfur protein
VKGKVTMAAEEKAEMAKDASAEAPAEKAATKAAAKTAAKSAAAKAPAKAAAKAAPPPIPGPPSRLSRPKTAAPKKKRERQIYTIIEELCIGCGFCTDECPPKVNAILPRDVEAVLDGGETYWIDQTRCISCSLCFVAGTCPTDAVVFTEGGVSRTQYMEDYMHIELVDEPYWRTRDELSRLGSIL